MKTKLVIIACFLSALLGCKRSEPPVDFVKTQRDALNQAKAVQGQLQQQAEDRLKAAEDAQK